MGEGKLTPLTTPTPLNRQSPNIADVTTSTISPYTTHLVKVAPGVTSPHIAKVTTQFLWTPAYIERSPLYFANVFFFKFFLWPPYSPTQVNGGSRNFYTWWTLSVIREVTTGTWIFSWSSLNYRVGQKVTKFRIFSDPARKLSALTPERGRIL